MISQLPIQSPVAELITCQCGSIILFSRESADPEGKEGKDTSVDIGVLKFSPQLKDTRELRAKPESGDTTQKFITSLTEAEKYEVRPRSVVLFLCP